MTWLSFELALHMRPLVQLGLHLNLHRDRKPDDPDMKACQMDGQAGNLTTPSAFRSTVPIVTTTSIGKPP